MVDDPVIQRLQFGERARQHRERAKVSFGEADKHLGSYVGKLSKIENGIIAAKPAVVEAMIELYGLTAHDADRLRELGSEARRRSAPQGAVMGTSRYYVSLERNATEIRMVYNEIPGLLQTCDFAMAALARSPMVPSGDLLSLAAARAARSTELIHSGGARVGIVLGVEALYREVGGQTVLRDQLVRLQEMSVLDNVSLRIVEWSAGACPALSVPFTLLYVPSARTTIAYVEAMTRPDYIKATNPYLAAFDQATAIAASEEASRAILDARVSHLSEGVTHAR
jgi:hypothetical protein